MAIGFHKYLRRSDGTDWECIKKWSKQGFTLRLYYLDGEYLAYEFKDGRKVIFKGKDFKPSPLHAIDSLDTVYLLLGFLCIKEGDVDNDYFVKYTQEQLDWMRSQRCDDLALIIINWEFKQEEKRNDR